MYTFVETLKYFLKYNFNLKYNFLTYKHKLDKIKQLSNVSNLTLF